jgi:hypothetical protein
MSDATRAPTALRHASRVTEVQDWVDNVKPCPEIERLLAAVLRATTNCRHQAHGVPVDSLWKPPRVCRNQYRIELRSRRDARCMRAVVHARSEAVEQGVDERRGCRAGGHWYGPLIGGTVMVAGDKLMG